MANPTSSQSTPAWAQQLSLEKPVVEAFRQLDQMVISLRFAEALRRNWEACRAEAAITSAAAGARLDGVEISDRDLRLLVVQNERSESAGWAYWRAHVWVTQQWEPLNVRGRGERSCPRPRLAAKARAAKIHALLTANLEVGPRAEGRGGRSGGGAPSGGVGIPSNPAAWQQFENLLNLSAPAPIRTGLALVSALRQPFFSQRGAEVARIMVRDELTSSGFEPTGTWQWEPTWEALWSPTRGAGAESEVPQAAALGAGAPDPESLRPGAPPSQSPAGPLSASPLGAQELNEWLHHWLQLLLQSHQPTRELLRRVQAGQLT